MKPLAQLPLPRALALLADGYLDEALAAVRRLDDAADSEALHDARVALRRLHSLMRAYPEPFAAAVPRKRRRQLRRLARASNPARDAEVQQAWVLQQTKGLTPAQLEGQRWLLARLQPATLLELEDALQKGVTQLARKLRPRFRALAGQAGHTPPYAAACAAQAQPLAEEVVAALAAIAGPDDMVGAHVARIRVKRLRYLLTPLRSHGPAAERAVAVLRQLQDVLGDLHDRHVLAGLLRESAAAAAAEHARELFDRAPAQPSAWRPPQLSGLVALATRNRTAMLACHDQLRRDYLDALDAAVRRPLEAALRELREGVRTGER